MESAHFGFPLETIIIFFVVIGFSVYMDLHAHRKQTEISVRDASMWSIFWIALALAFYFYLWFRFDKNWADLYLAGYVLEKSLSVDNLMVFMAIFSSFAIKGILQHRILYWGILGALVFRAIFVVIGTSLFHASAWVGFAFAAVVIWSAWKMQTASKEEGNIHDYSQHWSVKMSEKIMPIFPRLHLENFFITRKVAEDLMDADPSLRVPKMATFLATPAFLCLITIETSDVMFAFDSVPAIIAITQEPLLVYAAMIFAILGLRSLYFVLAALTKYLVHLEKAVIVLLYFIGAKLMLQSFNHAIHDTGIHLTPNASLLIVLGVLGGGVVASFLFPGKQEEEHKPST